MLLGGAVFIQSIPVSFAGQENVEDLKKQIETLQNRVTQLESQQQAQPTRTPTAHPQAAWSSSANNQAWNPFAEMMQMQDMMNRLFRDSLNRSDFSNPATPGSFYEPDLDIEERKDHYLMTLDLPGMEKNEINLDITENEIIISGQRNYQSEAQDDKQGFYRLERQFGSFSRRLPLPERGTAEGVEASYENGVLQIKIPKRAAEASGKDSTRVKIA